VLRSSGLLCSFRSIPSIAPAAILHVELLPRDASREGARGPMASSRASSAPPRGLTRPRATRATLPVIDGPGVSCFFLRCPTKEGGTAGRSVPSFLPSDLRWFLPRPPWSELKQSHGARATSTGLSLRVSSSSRSASRTQAPGFNRREGAARSDLRGGGGGAEPRGSAAVM
jgi:hypothetical protein